MFLTIFMLFKRYRGKKFPKNAILLLSPIINTEKLLYYQALLKIVIKVLFGQKSITLKFTFFQDELHKWNRMDVINKEEKDIQSYSLFQKKIKSKIIEIENETDYF